MEFNYIPLNKVLGSQFRFDFNTIALTRNVGEDDQRATMEARMRWPTVLPGGQLLTFQLDARADVYHVSDPTAPGSSDKYISRGIPYAALDWRWPFINNIAKDRSLILEPIVQAIAQPYGGNPAGIPDEDSAAFELDENNILSFDQLPGYDWWKAGAPECRPACARRVPVGSVDAVLGETYRLKPDPIFDPDSPNREPRPTSWAASA